MCEGLLNCKPPSTKLRSAIFWTGKYVGAAEVARAAWYTWHTSLSVSEQGRLHIQTALGFNESFLYSLQITALQAAINNCCMAGDGIIYVLPSDLVIFIIEHIQILLRTTTPHQVPETDF